MGMRDESSFPARIEGKKVGLVRMSFERTSMRTQGGRSAYDGPLNHILLIYHNAASVLTGTAFLFFW